MKFWISVMIAWAFLCGWCQRGFLRAGELPVIEPIPKQYMKFGELFTYDVEASGDPAPLFMLTSAPNGMAIDSVSGVITWTPVVEQVGGRSVTVRATNSAGYAETHFGVRVMTVSPAPVTLDPVPDQVVRALTKWTYTLNASGSPTPRYTVYGPFGMEVDMVTGLLSWRPSWSQAGVHEVTVCAGNIMDEAVRRFEVTVLPALFTLQASSEGGGSVTRPGEGYFEYPHGQIVAIEATPDAGHHFVFWSGTATVRDRTSPATTLTMSGNYTLVANFAQETGSLCSLTVTALNGGSIAFPGDGTFQYPRGTETSVTAVPNAGCRFLEWTGTAVDAGKVSDPQSAQVTVTVDESYSLRANFEIGTGTQWTLTVLPTTGGQVTRPGPGSRTYWTGSVVTIEAVPHADHRFIGWTGSAVDAGKVAEPMYAGTTIEIDADYDLLANFEPGERTGLTISASPGGHVSEPGEGAFLFAPGAHVSLSAAALNDYRFSGWTGSAVNAGRVDDPDSMTTFVTADGQDTLRANFEPRGSTLHYSLDLSLISGGRITNPGVGLFTYNSVATVSVTAEPRSGYEFVEWRGSAVEAGKVDDPTSASTTVTVDGDYTLEAYFGWVGAPDLHTLTVSAGHGGRILEPGEGSFELVKGTAPWISAEPISGYRFAGWTGTAVEAGEVHSPTSGRTRVTLSGDYTVEANFEWIDADEPCVLTVSSSSGGLVSSPGHGAFTYDDGTSLWIVARAHSGYEFSKWSGTAVDGGRVGDPAAAETWLSIDAPHTLRAHFLPIGQTTFRVLVPNGGEDLVAGNPCPIRWQGDGEVTIELSIDGGSTWTPVAAAATGGQYNWMVPTIDSKRCLIRIRAIGDAGRHDESDGQFHIRALETRTWYVDGAATGANHGTGWQDAFIYLQDALTEARNGDRIHIAEGVYWPDLGQGQTLGDRTAAFELGKGVTLLGGFPSGGGTLAQRNPAAYGTVLSGDIGTPAVADDNSYRVVFAGPGADSTVLDGCVITAGQADGPEPYDCGAGICMVAGATIRNCVVAANVAAGGGGGAYVAAANPTFINCLFAGNSSGHWGGALYSDGGRATLTNCTITANSAVWRAGGVFDMMGKATLVNCVLWGNHCTRQNEYGFQAQITGNATSTTVRHCCIQNWSDSLEGDHNTNSEPLFTDFEGPDGIPGTLDDDLRLRPGSPCIDAGDSTAVPIGCAIDLQGNLRVVGGTVDIGAYEHDGTPAD